MFRYVTALNWMWSDDALDADWLLTVDLDADGNIYSTTPSTPKIYYTVGMKLVGLAKNFVAPKIGSEEFNNLAGKFSRSMENSLNAIQGFDEVVVTEFKEYVLHWW